MFIFYLFLKLIQINYIFSDNVRILLMYYHKKCFGYPVNVFWCTF